MRFAFVAQKPTATTRALTVPRLVGVETAWLAPVRTLVQLGPGDVALGHLDVTESLDGVEPGLAVLGQLELQGVRVLNGARTLRSSHDKLLTATALARSGVPHPRTGHLVPDSQPPPLELPVVLKPRFGSWGQDVMLCRTLKELAGSIEVLRQRPWFNATGALVQELVPLRGHDLRLVVAAGRVLGAVRRIAQPGEWRTNVALGTRRLPVVPPRDARQLALAAAAAVGGDLVGVDLMENEDGFVVIEVNGAAEFTQEYSLGGDIFANVVSSLAGAAVLSCESWRIADRVEDPVAVGRLALTPARAVRTPPRTDPGPLASPRATPSRTEPSAVGPEDAVRVGRPLRLHSCARDARPEAASPPLRPVDTTLRHPGSAWGRVTVRS